jgi:hypothetical protein
MGRRSEQRIVIAFPVVVRGTDARGNAFVVTTETHDISCTGACLRGLQHVAEPGAKIEIECQSQKAWYRVQWASAANRRQEWRVGARCLEPGKYIWGIPPKEWEPDTFDASNANPPPARSPVPSAPAFQQPQRERRRFARHACRLEAQVATEGAYGKVVVNGKITDISLGGCYLEMLAPLPVETPVELTFSTGEAPLDLAAKVASSQEGFGMGLAFTGMSPQEFEILRQFAPPTNDPRKSAVPARYAAPHAGTQSEGASNTGAMGGGGTGPNAPPSAATRFDLYHAASAMELAPLDLPDPAIAVEALIRLLIRKRVFTVAELLEELERLKAAHI